MFIQLLHDEEQHKSTPATNPAIMKNIITVLYIGIMKVWDFLSQNIIPKQTKYLLCDI